MGETRRADNKQGDTCLPPSWLDKALIGQAIRNAGEKISQVVDIAVSLPLAPGDNYGSTIYRVKATLSDGQERSFIVKGPSSGAVISGISTEAGFFKREAMILADVIPQMEALLEEAAPGRYPPLAPRCYLHGTSPVEFIVLEDLGPPGFKMADRRRGLGLRHSLLALRSLARFHAASYALLKRQPELEEKLDNIWRSLYSSMAVLVNGEFEATAEACRSWPGFEECADRLQNFKPVAMETFAQLNDAKPGAFNVIGHGDYWVNNMMFRYDDGELRDIRSIDLQISHVTSPAIDVVYFLSGSVSDDVHEEHLDLLLREYHFELEEILELLGLQAPSLDSLLSAVNAHGPFSLFLALGRPIIKAQHGVDLDAVFAGYHSALVPLYELPDVKRWMQRVLPDYARKGWLPARAQRGS